MDKFRSPYRPRKRFPFWALVACLVVLPETAIAQTVSGTVLSVSGDVHLHRQDKMLTVRSGAVVDARDEILTGSGGRVSIGFADQNHIELGEDSESSIAVESGATASSRRDRVDLKTGIVEAFALDSDVEVHSLNAVIITHHGKADTSYFAKARRRGFASCQQFTDIAVLDGSVEVVASGQSRKIPSGYATTVACSGVALSPGPLGIADARTLSEETRGSGFLYSLFHGSSPNIEQEDIDGLGGALRGPEADDPIWTYPKVGPSRSHPHLVHPRFYPGPMRRSAVR